MAQWLELFKIAFELILPLITDSDKYLPSASQFQHRSSFSNLLSSELQFVWKSNLIFEISNVDTLKRGCLFAQNLKFNSRSQFNQTESLSLSFPSHLDLFLVVEILFNCNFLYKIEYLSAMKMITLYDLRLEEMRNLFNFS